MIGRCPGILAGILGSEDPESLLRGQRLDLDVNAMIDAMERESYWILRVLFGNGIDKCSISYCRFRNQDEVLMRNVTHRDIAVKVPVVLPCRRCVVLDEFHNSALIRV